MRQCAKDQGLKILSVIPGLFNEQRFKDGALISYDKKLRREAIDRIVTSMQMNDVLKKAGEGGNFAIYWPAADGVTYSFQAYHPERRQMMLDGLVEALQTAPGNIVIEHKPSDPAVKTYNGTTPENILLCRDIIKAIGESQKERIGINPEMAHLLMADADLGEEVSRILQEGLLRHTHWNTFRRKGADTDMMVGTDNWLESMEVFFWLDEYKYDRWLGLDLCPKSENSVRAIDVSIQAMERMYAEVMSIKDALKANMLNPALDATVNQELLMQARGHGVPSVAGESRKEVRNRSVMVRVIERAGVRMLIGIDDEGLALTQNSLLDAARGRAIPLEAEEPLLWLVFRHFSPSVGGQSQQPPTRPDQGTTAWARLLPDAAQSVKISDSRRFAPGLLKASDSYGAPAADAAGPKALTPSPSPNGRGEIHRQSTVSNPQSTPRPSHAILRSSVLGRIRYFGPHRLAHGRRL